MSWRERKGGAPFIREDEGPECQDEEGEGPSEPGRVHVSAEA